MAKEQKRSNRETRKPQQANAFPKADGPFANQVKLAANANGTRGKSRN
ncbi:hypothetical protein [Mesorhizobium tamadayense]|nr:hypothetical protein [Mesorhizobium tamadayense]